MSEAQPPAVVRGGGSNAVDGRSRRGFSAILPRGCSPLLAAAQWGGRSAISGRAHIGFSLPPSGGVEISPQSHVPPAFPMSSPYSFALPFAPPVTSCPQWPQFAGPMYPPPPSPWLTQASITGEVAGLQVAREPVRPVGGYFQNLLDGVSGNVVGQFRQGVVSLKVGNGHPVAEQLSSANVSDGSNGKSNVQQSPHTAPVSDGIYSSDGASDDSDEEEEQVYDDVEADDEGGGEEHDGTEDCQLSVTSDEDGIDGADDEPETVTHDVDESLLYEIIPVSAEDSGIVSTAPGFKKRIRFPKGVHPPECRTPRSVGTIEKALRNSKNRTTAHIFEPKLGMVFDSRAEAYSFYNLYSWEVGFGIRFGTSSRNRVNKYRTMQEIVCEKEGFDPRCTASSKRDHCKAMLRLHRSEDHGWYVSRHVAEHNHPLSISCAEKREWNSHSKIEQCTKDMIRYLRENNVSLSRVHCIMGSMFGSMNDIPFNQKSLRAVCAEIARDHKDDDVAKTLEVFRKMRAEDPAFQFSVDLDEQKKIKTLIWTSGRSRSQYNFFGDAITFDTTYCTNLYKMPFGMFVGVNNHFQTVLFAGVLMREETAASFKWVFNEFITLMGGKAPKTILTDQCKAMKKAIMEVLANTTNLWCKWHIFKDAPEELGPVYRWNGPFRRELHFVINQMLTVDEFEKAWDDLLERYKLRGHPFMEKTYKKKKMWAKPWCKDIFCARMASTQRSESANSILKKVVPRNCFMNMFVEQYRKLLFIRASAEEKAEHKTKQFVHRGNRVYAIEKHAISVYTRKVCELFSSEVDKAAAYNVLPGESDDEVKVVHYNEEVRKHWARVVFSVKIDDDGEKLTCECGMYEHFGILCCHAIKVLIHFGATKIPEAHIMKRWTREAKDFEYPKDTRNGVVDAQVRNSVLYANALEVVRSAEKDEDASSILLNYLTLAKNEIHRLFEERNKDKNYGYTSGSDIETADSKFDFEDGCGNTYGAGGSSAYMSDADLHNIQAPSPRKSTGRPRQNRFPRMFERFKKGKKKNRRIQYDDAYCERCNEHGHDRKNCNLKPKAKGKLSNKKLSNKPIVASKKGSTKNRT